MKQNDHNGNAIVAILFLKPCKYACQSAKLKLKSNANL